MESMYIGSGECNALLSKKTSEVHRNLLRRFVSNQKVNYNAFASPIDALRTGAIIEERFKELMPDNCYYQNRVVCKEMNVLRSSLDFSFFENGKLINFIEMKSINFEDYLELMPFKNDYNGFLNFVKKNYKKYYNQCQFQLLCTGLEKCNLLFVRVDSYNDDENWTKDISFNETIELVIERDNKVISEIKERAKMFQELKNYYIND